MSKVIELKSISCRLDLKSFSNFENSCDKTIEKPNENPRNITCEEDIKILKKYRRILRKNSVRAFEMLKSYVENNLINDYRVYKELGIAYQFDNLKKSNEYLDKALQMNPRDIQLYIEKANNYLIDDENKKSNILKAERILKSGLIANRFEPRLYNELYMTVRNMDPKKAMKYLKFARTFALKQTKKYRLALFDIEVNLLSEYNNSSDYEGVIDVITSLHSRNQYLNENSLAELAVAYNALDNTEIAEIYYNKALEAMEPEFNEDRIKLMFDLGMIYYDTGRIEEVKNMFNTILKNIDESHNFFDDVSEMISEIDEILLSKQMNKQNYSNTPNIINFNKRKE